VNLEEIESEGIERWAGWETAHASFGGEFDGCARRRMIEGASKLRPYLTKYWPTIGRVLVEVGPFFNPLIEPRALSAEQALLYWENDEHACRWLSRAADHRVHTMCCDVTTMESADFEISAYPRICGSTQYAIDAVVCSQVLNYIDSRRFFQNLSSRVATGGLLFINNVVDYGLPTLFSHQRPTSIDDTIESMGAAGFELVEGQILRGPRATDHPRLVAIGRRT
jgi:hypothetical protein